MTSSTMRLTKSVGSFREETFLSRLFTKKKFYVVNTMQKLYKSTRWKKVLSRWATDTENKPLKKVNSKGRNILIRLV